MATKIKSGKTKLSVLASFKQAIQNAVNNDTDIAYAAEAMLVYEAYQPRFDAFLPQEAIDACHAALADKKDDSKLAAAMELLATHLINDKPSKAKAVAPAAKKVKPKTVRELAHRQASVESTDDQNSIINSGVSKVFLPAKKGKRGPVIATKPRPTRVENNAYDTAIASGMKIPTKKQARALRTGDLILAYYNDVTEPTESIVIRGCEPDGDIYGVRIISVEAWNSAVRKEDSPGFSGMNTDLWKHVGHSKVEVHRADLSLTETRSNQTASIRTNPRIRHELVGTDRDGKQVCVLLTAAQAKQLKNCFSQQG